MSCPMTIENCIKYNISDKQAERFCKDGCSVDCEEEFMERFENEKQDKAVHGCQHG